MKKFFLLGLCLLFLLGALYFFSTPQILERRLHSLTSSLSFKLIELGDKEEAADRFASHFAEEISFSGSENEIITGKVVRDELRALYLERLRTFARSCEANITGDTHIESSSTSQAITETQIVLSIKLLSNEAYQQKFPALLNWEKQQGRWVIAGVQLQRPLEDVYDLE